MQKQKSTSKKPTRKKTVKKTPTTEEIKQITLTADKVSKIIRDTKQVEKRIDAAIARSCTLVLGDHKNLKLLKAVCKGLKKKNIRYLLVKLVKSNINDILKSKLLMKEADFILMIDGKGAGTVGESHYAISNKNIASKLHLFIPASKEKTVWNYKRHYLFFPRFDFWGSKKNLIEYATKIADKEMHRLAYLEIVKEAQCWGCPQHTAPNIHNLTDL